jgi:lipid II:glycine glycyltransferase (peptidoglycan interpeptide bridge formation enzyme)
MPCSKFKTFWNPDVYEKIINAYCQPKELLAQNTIRYEKIITLHQIAVFLTLPENFIKFCWVCEI